MSTSNRTLVALASLLLGSTRTSTAADCPRTIVELQSHLGSFGVEATPLGPTFLRDDGLNAALEAFRKRLDGLSDADRTSTSFRGFIEAQDASNKLRAWDQRLTKWTGGIDGYATCLKDPACSIGDLIKRQEASNREFAAWLQSFADEGLEKANQKLGKASEVLRGLRARTGNPTTGTMAAALMCASENRPRTPAPPAPASPRAPALATPTPWAAAPPPLISPPPPRPASAPLPAPTLTPNPAAVPHAMLNIDHQPVACAVAERFPRLEARFTPPDAIARAQVLFQGDIAQEWYAVAMKEDGLTFSGILPKPKKSLKAFRYYIEVTNKSLETNRTADYTATVVGSASECKGKIMAGTAMAASILLVGPAGAVAVPAGFASVGVVVAGSAASAGAVGAAGGGGGLSTGAIAGIVGGVGVAGAVAAKAGGGKDSTSTASTPSQPTPTPAPTPVPTPAPTPVPTPTPGVTQYDGNYSGQFSGSFAGSPVSGPVVYQVSNGQLLSSEPPGGVGTVDSTGSTTFGGKVNLGNGVDCSFKGAFVVGSASGTWACSGGGSSGSGNWNAQRQ